MGVYLYSKLPSEYQEVEYVQSSGTQYIDTGYIATANTKFYIKASTKGESGHTGLFGSRSLSATNPFLSYIELSYNSTPNVIRVDVNNITGDTGYRWVIDTPFEIEIDAPNKKVSVDGNQISRYDNFTATFSSVTLSLFAMHGGTNGVMKYNYPIVGRIYGCKIWDSGTLVRDFVPCYRKLDSVIGMYDLANGVFYTNSGSGTFTKGADVDGSHEYPLKNAYIGEVGEYTISNIPTTDTNIYVNVARSGKTIQSVTFKFIVNWASSKGVYIQMSTNNSNTMRYGPVLETGAGTGLRIRGRTSGSDTYFRTITTGYNSGGVNNVEFTINRDGTGKVICNGGITNYTATGSELTIIQTIMNLSNMNVYAAQNANMLSGSKVDTTVTYS